MGRIVGTLSLVGVMALALAASASAAPKTFVVTTTADAPPGSCTKSACTLRDATIAANDHPGPDTIEVGGGKTYKITQAGAPEDASQSGDLDLTGPTTIVGKGKGKATIDGNHLDFEVFSALNATLTVVGLEVVNSNGVGVAGFNAKLILRGCSLHDNPADGVAEDGTGSVKAVRTSSTGGHYGIDEEGDGGISVRGGNFGHNDYGIAEFGSGSISAKGVSVPAAGNYGLEEAGEGSLKAVSSKVNRVGQYGITEFDAGNLTVKASTVAHAGNYGLEETSTGNLKVTRSHIDDAGQYAITEFDAGSLTASHVTANKSGNYALEETSDGNLTASHVTAKGGSQYGITEFDAGDLNASRTKVTEGGNYGVEETGGGDLDVSRSTIFANVGAGIADYDGGGGTISKSTISGNDGGGVLKSNTGTLDLVDSTVSGNTVAGDGGGVSVFNASMNIANSTIDGNKADGIGGGISLLGSGAVSLNAVTITRNIADRDGTGSEWGGGVYQGANTLVHSKNSLIARNDVAKGFLIVKTGLDCYGETAPLDSQGHNLIGDDIGCESSWDGPGDQVNKDPRIAKLASNGGPTKTVALKKGSPAIGKAAKSAPATDQRGRKRDKHPDIGAFERGA